MAKDGTNRGGARIGSGRKPKALSDKLLEGRIEADIELPQVSDLEGVDMPPVKYYMTATQKAGQEFDAKEVFEETWKWLKERRCDEYVNPQLLHQYAMSVARWIQCETAISEYGFLAKHPTTGGAISSPYVTMSREYMKQINQIWFQIAQTIRENSTADFGNMSPQDDMMERLLSAKRKRP